MHPSNTSKRKLSLVISPLATEVKSNNNNGKRAATRILTT
jgi:hypothetical protein